LQALLTKARARNPNRSLDLILLTVGANDIDFSGLVANVIIDTTAERLLFRRSGVMTTVEESEGKLAKNLPGDFSRLRAALKPLVGGALERIIYVSYGHPALAADGAACPGTRDGFDVHPAFALNTERLRKVADYVRDGFLPRLKALATCADGVCRDSDRFTFVDAHQPAFVAHGICARAETDPDFDRECFSGQGESFEASPVEGATAPLVCSRPASDFRAYLPRERWIRTANDSYFAAMTFPEGIPATMQPADIHDATWGVLSAVYGGAVHPTAEGHAAMADAALAAVHGVLHLAPEIPIAAELPPSPTTAPPEPTQPPPPPAQ
jgi:hypothetical protein